MIRVQDILDFLNAKAPLDTAEPWDNAGLLVGDAATAVQTVVTALDITPQVIRFAQQTGAQLIVAHHPVIFAPLRTLSAQHPAYLLANSGICAVCWHTNLDQAAGGVADTLAAQLGLRCVQAADGYVRIGTLETPLSPADFVKHLNTALHTQARGCRGNAPVSRVAVFGGALDEASVGHLLQADAVVFGECKHHVRLEFVQSGKTVCEAGHFATEHAISAVLCDWLQQAFPSLTVVRAPEQAPFSVL